MSENVDSETELGDSTASTHAAQAVTDGEKSLTHPRGDTNPHDGVGWQPRRAGVSVPTPRTRVREREVVRRLTVHTTPARVTHTFEEMRKGFQIDQCISTSMHTLYLAHSHYRVHVQMVYTHTPIDIVSADRRDVEFVVRIRQPALPGANVHVARR